MSTQVYTKSAACEGASPPRQAVHGHTVLFVDDAPLLSQLVMERARLADAQCRSVVIDSVAAAAGALEAGLDPCLIVVSGQFSAQQLMQFLAVKGRTSKAAVPVVWLRGDGDAPAGCELGAQVAVTSSRDALRIASFCPK